MYFKISEYHEFSFDYFLYLVGLAILRFIVLQIFFIIAKRCEDKNDIKKFSLLITPYADQFQSRQLYFNIRYQTSTKLADR